MAPSRSPSHTGPHWCGQRFCSANSSPPTLKTPTSIPPTLTIFLAPSGNSAAGNRISAMRPVPKAEPLHRVVPHDPLLANRVEQAERPVARRLEVPVRIVGGEQHPVIHAEFGEEVGEPGRRTRLVERLRRRGDLFAHLLARRPGHVRDL